MIRPEQVDLSSYLTAAEISGIIPSTSGFATQTELINASGTLNTKINTVSGLLYSGYVAADAVLSGYMESSKLNVDQTSPQTITGFLLYADGHAEFTDQHHLVDKQYVDASVAKVGAEFFLLDAADVGVAIYKQTSLSPSALTVATVDSPTISSSTDTAIEDWISPSGIVFSSLAEGIYNLNIFAERTTGNRNCRLFWRLYERKTDNSEVLISTSNLGDLLTSKERQRVYCTLATEYTLSAGSRLVGKVYVQTSSGSQNTVVRLYYQGNDASHFELPINQEFLNSNYVTSGVFNSTINNLTLDSLSGVVCPTPSSGQILKFDGVNWINATVSTGGGVTDHGELTGLNDDDHSGIYYNKTTMDNMSGALYSGYIAADSTLSGLLYSGYVAADSNLSGTINTRLLNLDLDALSGVVVSTPSSGQLIQYNGTNWVNATVSTGGGGSGVPFISLAKSTGQSVSNSDSALSWDVERAKNTTYFTHSNSTNNSRIYCNVSGTYQVQANGARDDASVRNKIKVNVDGSTRFWVDHTSYGGICITGAVNLASGSYIEIISWNNSAKTMGVDCSCTVYYIG